MHLPTSHLPTPQAQNTLATDYSVSQDASGWVVTRATWFIDRQGHKDVHADQVSAWPTELEAEADIVARKLARAA